MKACTKCFLIKEENQFRVHTSGRVETWCIVCKAEYDRNYYQQNSQKIREASRNYQIDNLERSNASKREWAKNNSEKVNESRELWKANNPDKVKKQKNERRKIRRALEPEYLLIERCRLALKRAFTAQGIRKTRHDKTLDLLGCTPVEFRYYIASQLRDGMTFENYGSVWHLDHIIPISRFDFKYRDHIVACNHYTNIQPLFAIENLKKHNGSDDYDWKIAIQEQINKVRTIKNGSRATKAA